MDRYKEPNDKNRHGEGVAHPGEYSDLRHMDEGSEGFSKYSFKNSYSDYEKNKINTHKIYDTEILRKVMRSFETTVEIDPSQIKVVVRDGIVYLSGRVSSRKEKVTAEALVEEVDGIKDIFNSLTIHE